MGGMLDYAKYGVLGLGLLLFAFFVWRGLRKRERDAIAEPKWLSQIEAPTTLAALESGPAHARPIASADEPDPHEMARTKVEDLAANEPEILARHVRSWMDEEGGPPR